MYNKGSVLFLFSVNLSFEEGPLSFSDSSLFLLHKKTPKTKVNQNKKFSKKKNQLQSSLFP